ncbi:MAG: hypothetical protein AB7Q00_10175 [Phycisphaerales bacterium]|nr:MAG: hypothetical protein IPK69_13485 [Phycisphaerales bacterium]
MAGMLAFWNRQSPVIKVALGAVLVLALYFGVVEPVINKTKSINNTADAKATELVRFEAERQARLSADQDATIGVTRFGIVDGPGERVARSEDVNRAISKILAENDVQPLLTTREVPLGNAKSPLTAFAKDNEQVQRLQIEIAFDSSPEQLARVLAGLEREPKIAVINRLQTRIASTDRTSRVLRSTINVEAWQIIKKAARTRP